MVNNVAWALGPIESHHHVAHRRKRPNQDWPPTEQCPFPSLDHPSVVLFIHKSLNTAPKINFHPTSIREKLIRVKKKVELWPIILAREGMDMKRGFMYGWAGIDEVLAYKICEGSCPGAAGPHSAGPPRLAVHAAAWDSPGVSCKAQYTSQ